MNLSLITPSRTASAIANYHNAALNIDANRVVSALDKFERGYLRDAALLWDNIERRDDLVQVVAAKRKKTMARHGCSVTPKVHESHPHYKDALQHQQVLQYFYENLTVCNAYDLNECGTCKLLARQMMDAMGKRYSVHEIIWKPSRSGDLTAELRWVPLWFFENTTGRLRFLEKDHDITGIPLDPASWMVTVGDGLMIPTSIAWLFKKYPLNDWLDFCTKYGFPSIIASTTSPRGTAGFDDMIKALADFVRQRSIVTTATENINALDLQGHLSQPFAELVERMDRRIAALWRGADLNTLSREHGYGASIQSGETQILEEDDAQLLSDTLHRHLDKRVIEYHFGKGVLPLAQVKIIVSPRRGTNQDIEVDRFLLESGVPLSRADALHRYGRNLAHPGEPKLTLKDLTSVNESTTLDQPDTETI